MLLQLFAFSALAHSGSSHRVQHYIKWYISPNSTEVSYTVDLPPEIIQGQDPESIVRELVSGLSLSGSGHEEYELQLIRQRLSPLQNGLRANLYLRAEHSSEDLILSNGNFIESHATSTVVITINPILSVDDSSLFVYHNGHIARTESGRPQASPRARKISVRTHSRGLLDQMHRYLQGNWYPQEISVDHTSYKHNQTGTWGLILPLFGALTPTKRSESVSWGSASIIAFCELCVFPTAYSTLFIGIAIFASFATVRWPQLSLLALIAAAASLDIYGAGIATLLVAAAASASGLAQARFVPWVVALLVAIQTTRISVEVFALLK